MEITKGKIEGAQKVVIFGPEGIGKSTLAAQFPDPVFTDTEGSTKHMDVKRFPKPTSWTMLLEQVAYVKANPATCSTYAIDTVDWAEQLCKVHVCAKANKDGLEDFGFGKGYTYLAEEFGKLLNSLTELIERGINVVLVAHAQMRKFEQPDEMGAYDRWELKLEKKVHPLVKEWADMVLFCNYKTYVIDADGQGAAKGKNKAQGGKRVMYTSHHPCWDAKNRHDLAEELPMEYKQIASCFTTKPAKAAAKGKAKPEPVADPAGVPVPVGPVDAKPEPVPATPITPAEPIAVNIPKPLADLMQQNSVTVAEIQKAVASKGYYPADTPIENYDAKFISGVLVGAWQQVFKMVQDGRQVVMNLSDVPFK